MCYNEELYRSWLTKRAQKREKDLPVTGQDRRPHLPTPTAAAPETKRREEVEHEVEEVV
jgi:hypothetical protein